MIKLSIIIPVYNSSKILEKCLHSIYDHNKEDGYEVIVVDDGSSDNSSDIAKKFKCRVFRQKRSGQSTARNLGAKKAKYDILFFVDSDVILKPDALKEMKNSFKDKKNKVVCGIYSKESANEGLWPSITSLFLHYVYTRKEIKNLKIFGSECAAIKKKIFFEIGGFDEKLNKNAAENEDFGYRISKKYRIIYNQKIQFLHHFPNFLLSVKKNFYRTYYWVKLFSKYKKFESFRNPKNASIAIIGFIGLALMVLYIIFQSLIFIFFATLCFTIYIINFLDFYSYVYKEKGLLFTLVAVVGSYILSITVVVASFLATSSIIFESIKK
jgi:glycosyltransferase involved in cell wall biosynthesis